RFIPPLSICLFYVPTVLLHLHSFPTRRSSDLSLFEHDLFGKPLHTFPDHALARPVLAFALPGEGSDHLLAGINSTGLKVVGTLTDRKSTRLNSSHGSNSYAVLCLKKNKKNKAG